MEHKKLIKYTDFIKNHPELPEVDGCHFISYCCWTDVTSYLVVNAKGSSLNIIPVYAKIVKGSAADGSAEYEYFIDEKEYNTELESKFKDTHRITKTRAKHRSGYHDLGTSKCYYHLSDEPREYYDPSF